MGAQVCLNLNGKDHSKTNEFKLIEYGFSLDPQGAQEFEFYQSCGPLEFQSLQKYPLSYFALFY